MKKPKRRSERKILPGLWFAALSIEVQEVTERMKKECIACGVNPFEAGPHRLVVTKGSGRRHTTEVYCVTCGDLYLQEKVAEAQRAVQHIRTGNVCIRNTIG